MAIQIPTTREINDLLIAQLEAAFNTAIPLLPRGFNRVLAKALAGVFTVLYKYGGFIFLQVFVSSATISETEINGRFLSPLKEWGRLLGIGDPAAGTAAELIIDINVENQTGTLSTGSQLVGGSNGVTYITLADVLLDAPTVQATIRAVADTSNNGGAGSVGNLDDGTFISFANPLPNISRQAVVSSTVTQGTDGETEEAYRARVVDAFQKTPQGGAYADYEQWGEEDAGIINAYPYSGLCPGQVDVYLEATEASSGSPDGIPTTAQLQDVLDNHIDLDVTGLASRRPVNALANTFPITRPGYKVTVSGIQDVDNLAATYEDIENGLTSYFLGRGPFIPGLSIPPRKDRINKSAIAGVVEDIVSARGGIFDSVTEVTRGEQSLSGSSYTGDSININAEEFFVYDFNFSADGKKAYTLGKTDTVQEFALTTAFDIGTMSSTGNSLDITPEDSSPFSFWFSQSGDKLFVLGGSGDIFEYVLSDPYNLGATVSYTGVSFSVSAQSSSAFSLVFDPTGLRFFVLDQGSSLVYGYNLTSPFALTTAYYNGFFHDAGAEATSAVAPTIHQRGSRFTVVSSLGTAYEYCTAVPYDLGSIVSYTGEYYDFTNEAPTVQSIAYNADKSQVNAADPSSDEIFKYDTGVVDVPIAQTYALARGEKAKLLEVTYE